MKQSIKLTCLGVLLVAGPIACDGSGRDQARSKSNARDPVGGARNSATSAQDFTVQTTIPADVTYTVINTNVLPGIKRSLDVRLSRKVEKDVLQSIAMNLKKSDPKRYERTFIVYYLRDTKVGAGGWATTHFNPDLNVRILGLTIEEENKLTAQPEPGNREIIGRWLGKSPLVGSRITIFREEDKLFIEQTFKDGSSLKRELVERKIPLGRRFDLKPSPKKQEPSEATAGRQFLKSKLADLDSFKSDPKFHDFGFGIGGPFNSWLKSVESKRNAAGFSLLERVAVGDLQMLGLEYIGTKGRENDYTRYARKQITQAMQEGTEVEGSGAGDHWVLDSNRNLQVRDNDGLIATAKRIE